MHAQQMHFFIAAAEEDTIFGNGRGRENFVGVFPPPALGAGLRIERKHHPAIRAGIDGAVDNSRRCVEALVDGHIPELCPGERIECGEPH